MSTRGAVGIIFNGESKEEFQEKIDDVKEGKPVAEAGEEAEDEIDEDEEEEDGDNEDEEREAASKLCKLDLSKK